MLINLCYKIFNNQLCIDSGLVVEAAIVLVAHVAPRFVVNQFIALDRRKSNSLLWLPIVLKGSAVGVVTEPGHGLLLPDLLEVAGSFVVGQAAGLETLDFAAESAFETVGVRVAILSALLSVLTRDYRFQHDFSISLHRDGVQGLRLCDAGR